MIKTGRRAQPTARRTESADNQAQQDSPRLSSLLEDILSGDVQTPETATHYKVTRAVDGQEQIVYRGCGIEGVFNDLYRIIYQEPDGFAMLWKKEWPASCEWVVEWEQEKGAND